MKNLLTFLRYNYTSILFISAFLFRLLLIPVAYHGDLNNNISWGNLAVERGLNGFYGSPKAEDWPYSAPNQPPLYILLFATTSFLWGVIDRLIWYLNSAVGFFPSSLVWYWQQKGMTLLVKLPSVLADISIAYLIYKYLVRNNKGAYAKMAATVWLFNPVTWYNSSVWGQTDPVVNLLGLSAVFALLEKKLVRFSILFVLSILFKGSLSIFVPVLLILIWRQRYDIKTLAKAILGTIIAVFAIGFWFHPTLDFPVWLINLYAGRILPGEIGYLTANAFNLWWLINPGRVYDSVLYFGIPARIVGIFMTTLGFGYLAYLTFRRRITDKSIFLALSVSSLIAFILLTRMHERYLYPFFPYATLVLFEYPGFLLLYILLSAGHLINLYNLFWVPDIPVLKTLLISGLSLGISIVNSLSLLYVFRLLGRTNGSQQKEKKHSRQ